MASNAWKLLSPDVQSLPRQERLQLTESSLVAFIALNDHSRPNGEATTLTSIRNAKSAVRRARCSASTDGISAANQVEHISAVGAKRLSVDDHRLIHFSERLTTRLRLTAVPEWQTAFHASVYEALRCDDGWGAAMLLEARGELLADADDVHLCREALAWCDAHSSTTPELISPELRAHLLRSLRSTQRRHAARARRKPAARERPARSASRLAANVRMMMEPPEEIECDVAIVGGGPAGCTCALYTSRANLHTVVLDKNPSIGALAITSHIANYPGVDKSMTGQELLDKMREQAIDYGTDYRRAQVFLVEVEPDTDRKIVYTPEATIKARALVLATGAMGRPPSFKGEDTFLGKGVSYCATCDGAFYNEREVAVVGTNQEAIEEAQFLTKFASTVHWITPNDPKKDDAHAAELIALPNVKHWSKTRMELIEGDASGVTGVQLAPRGAEEPCSLPVEGVFIYMAGSKPIVDFLEGKVALQDDGGVQVDDEMATSVPGVFAIGDIRNTPYKQVVVAASDGCIAAMSIERYLKGLKTVRVDWIHK